MNFQQLKIIREAARQDYNLTEVANILYTSQLRVSRHIRELFPEVRLDLIQERRKRLMCLYKMERQTLVLPASGEVATRYWSPFLGLDGIRACSSRAIIR